MPRKAKGKAEKGSRKWLQVLVNSRPSLVDSQIRALFGWKDNVEINWRSPLKNDGYAEYSDGEFLDSVDLASLHKLLRKFWPAGGPEWDALATTSDRKVILVEAKAHVPEMVTSATGASEKSKATIKGSLSTVRKDLCVTRECDWTGTFYQYTNRVAHLHFLRECNHVEAYLVFIHFINASEVKGPTSVEEWKGAIQVVQTYLGLSRHKLSKYMADVFIDVNDLRK